MPILPAAHRGAKRLAFVELGVDGRAAPPIVCFLAPSAASTCAKGVDSKDDILVGILKNSGFYLRRRVVFPARRGPVTTTAGKCRDASWMIFPNIREIL